MLTVCYSTNLLQTSLNKELWPDRRSWLNQCFAAAVAGLLVRLDVDMTERHRLWVIHRVRVVQARLATHAGEAGVGDEVTDDVAHGNTSAAETQFLTSAHGSPSKKVSAFEPFA